MKTQQDKYRKIIMLFVLFVLLAGFLLYTTCSLKTVSITGSSHYSEKELKQEILSSKTDGNTILFYLRMKYGRKTSIPFVEDITVNLVDRHSIKLHVYEKPVIGCIQYMGSYMYFDKDGIMVESSEKKLKGVPFVSGLDFNSFVLHSKMDTSQNELFPVILDLTRLIQKFSLKVDTIRFSSDSEVLLKSGENEVLLGKRDTYDEQMAELKNLLPSSPAADGKKLLINMKDFVEGQEKIVARPIE